MSGFAISGQFAQDTVRSLLESLKREAARGGGSPADQKILAEGEFTANGPYAKGQAAVYAALQAYEAHGGRVTVADMEDPRKVANLMQSIQKSMGQFGDGDNYFERHEATSPLAEAIYDTAQTRHKLQNAGEKVRIDDKVVLVADQSDPIAQQAAQTAQQA